MGTRAETTRKEKAILKFIENQVNKNGYPPSVREIGKAIGLSSKWISTISKRNRKSNWIKFNCNCSCLFIKIRKTRIY